MGETKEAPPSVVRSRSFQTFLVAAAITIVVALSYAARSNEKWPFILDLAIGIVFVACLTVLFGYPIREENSSAGIDNQSAKSFWALAYSMGIVCATAVLAISLFSQPLFRDPAAIRAYVQLEGIATQATGLFVAPTPQVQQDYFARISNNSKNVLPVLKRHENSLSTSAVGKAAIFAFATEDYTLAEHFADIALERSPDDARALVTRGLVEYQQDLYQQALSSFQKAENLLSIPEHSQGDGQIIAAHKFPRHQDSQYQPSVVRFESSPRAFQSDASASLRAALQTDVGLTHWQLGNPTATERSFRDSLTLLQEMTALYPMVYVVSLEAKFRADTDDFLQSIELNKKALKLARDLGPLEEGQSYRQLAEVRFLVGNTAEAKDLIQEAVVRHQSSPFELAMDWDQLGEIVSLSSPQDGLEWLRKAAAYYKEIHYDQGEAENSLKQARTLVDLGDFQAPEALILSAERQFQELGSKKGIGLAEDLLGQLKFKQAQSLMISRGSRETVLELLNEAKESYNKAEDIFANIRNKRGVADVSKHFCTFDTTIFITGDQSAKTLSSVLRECQKVINLYQEIKSQRGEADAHGNLGILYFRVKNFKSSFRELATALSIHRQIGYVLGVGRQLGNIGKLYMLMGDKSQAIRNYSAALEVLTKIQARFELDVFQKALDCVDRSASSTEVKACAAVFNTAK